MKKAITVVLFTLKLMGEINWPWITLLFPALLFLTIRAYTSLKLNPTN